MTDVAQLVVLGGECGPCSQPTEYGAALLIPTRSVVTAGGQGPPGVPGIPGPAGGSAVQRTAGETISALQVVYELDGAVYVLDYRDTAHIDLLLGVAITSANTGEPLNVQRSGTLDDAGWGWSSDIAFLGAAGTITQTPPTDGFRVRMGSTPSAGRLNLDISEPIELG